MQRFGRDGVIFLEDSKKYLRVTLCPGSAPKLGGEKGWRKGRRFRKKWEIKVEMSKGGGKVGNAPFSTRFPILLLLHLPLISFPSIVCTVSDVYLRAVWVCSSQQEGMYVITKKGDTNLQNGFPSITRSKSLQFTRPEAACY